MRTKYIFSITNFPIIFIIVLVITYIERIEFFLLRVLFLNIHFFYNICIKNVFGYLFHEVPECNVITIFIFLTIIVTIKSLRFQLDNR